MKEICLKLIILFLISITPVALYNYLNDPYGIFHDESLKLGYPPGYEPNQHYAKIRHLISDKHSWDSYLFGNSRVGKINTEIMSDGRYYNLNYSEGIPGEHLTDIKVLLQEGIPIKNVIIGLDNFSYLFRPEEHSSQILRHPYDISPFKRMLFKIKYLCSVPPFIMMRYIRSNENELSIHFNIMENGVQDLSRVDMNIESNIENHINSERFRLTNEITINKTVSYESVKLMEDTIKDIAEIIKLSKSHSLNLYFFINPIHKLHYLQNNPYLFLLFKKELAQLTGYWDFSGFNSVTTNNYYYYEMSHYRKIVGDLIVCRLNNCTDSKVPKDFGIFINIDNVSDHIKREKERLNAYRNYSTQQ